MKHLFRSKTFWFQVISVAATLSGSVPIPPEYAVVVTALVNMGLRLVTTESVSIAPKK